MSHALPFGLALVLVALGLWFRRGLAPEEGAGGEEREERASPRFGTWFPGALGLALSCAGAAEVLVVRGALPDPWPLLARAAGNPLLLPALLFATAALLTPARGRSARTWCALQFALLLAGALLALGWHRPAARFLLPPASLLLALVALHGLVASARPARTATALVAIALTALAALHAPPAPEPAPAEQDELVTFTTLPRPGGVLTGTLSDEVPAATVRARLERVAPTPAADAVSAPLAAAQDATRAFSLTLPSDLAPGTWFVTLEVLAADGTHLGERYAGALDVPPSWPERLRTLAPWLPALATLLVLLLLPARRRAPR